MICYTYHTQPQLRKSHLKIKVNSIFSILQIVFICPYVGPNIAHQNYRVTSLCITWESQHLVCALYV